jgi:peptidoglycan/xylan/chitin deacetylase (PgdA/CDA1 family)
MKKIFLGLLVTIVLFSCNTKTDKGESGSTKENGKASSGTNSGLMYDTTKKKIYLTFDDGPTVGSKRLYDLILQEKIPVGLYLVGEHYEKMPAMHKYLDTFKSLNYVMLANHSFSHGWHDKYLAFYSNPPAVIEDYQKSQGILGITSGIARCAGRNVWRTDKVLFNDSGKGPHTAMDSLYKMGYQFTGWDRTWPYDYKTFKNTKNTTEMLEITRKYFDSASVWMKTPNHFVILGHDQQYADDEDFKQLTDFIDSIKASKKYEFASMADYPGIKRVVK